MKKYLYIFVCIAISMVFMVGCGNVGNCDSFVGTENPVTETASNQPAETTDWEPTPYKIINNFDDVTMTVEKGTITSTSLIVAFKNNSSSQCLYGEYFGLENEINGMWYQVPVIIDGNYGFNDIGYKLASKEARKWTVDWDWLYGSLNTGKYRIVKDIEDFRATGDYDKYFLAAEFTIY